MSWFDPFVTYERASLVAFMIRLISLDSLESFEHLWVKSTFPKQTNKQKEEKKREIDLKIFVTEKFKNQDVII